MFAVYKKSSDVERQFSSRMLKVNDIKISIGSVKPTIPINLLPNQHSPVSVQPNSSVA